MTLPTFLVAGAARSGTTALVEGLKTHPGVFITDPKEPQYFGLHGRPARFTAPGDEATINKVAVTDRGSYLELFPDTHSFQALGDAAVTTLYHYDHAIPEILDLVPDAKIVMLLREPVARAMSAYDYLKARGFETAPTFLEAVELEESRIEQGYHHLWHYVRMSRYADGVAAFQAAFPAEQLGIWFYDEMQADYVSMVREVLRFIGTAPADGEAEGVPQVNASGTPRSEAAKVFFRAATGNEWLRASVKKMTSYRFREAVRSRLLTRNEMDDEVREKLTPVFSDDLARLATMVPADRRPSWLVG